MITNRVMVFRIVNRETFVRLVNSDRDGIYPQINQFLFDKRKQRISKHPPKFSNGSYPLFVLQNRPRPSRSGQRSARICDFELRHGVNCIIVYPTTITVIINRNAEEFDNGAGEMLLGSYR